MRHSLAYLLLVCILWLPAVPAAANTTKTSKTSKTRMMRMEATAFTQTGNLTASGTVPRKGIVAADPAILPLGSRIRISDAGVHNGVYTVADTGGHIDGHRIDVFVTTAASAKKFGRKMVTVHVLRIGTGKVER